MKSLEELFSLQGKSALITGGAGYLGKAISYTLAELGANLIIAGRDVQKSSAVCEEIMQQLNQSIQATAMELDVTDKTSIIRCFEKVSKSADGLDLLVNNAWSGNKNTLTSISDDDWNYDMEVSLNGVFRCVKQFLPLLKQKNGVILNIASMYGHVAPDYRLYEGTPFTNPPSYGAAKAGVIQLTKYLAGFLAPDGIRVNCISPGPFPHPSTQRQERFIQRLRQKNPLNRIGQPQEIKGTVALLCSDASSYITGQNICVDGGWSIW